MVLWLNIISGKHLGTAFAHYCCNGETACALVSDKWAIYQWRVVNLLLG